MPAPVLISMLHPFKGAQQAHCEVEGCGNVVWEQPENLALVREQKGIIVCAVCFLQIKMELPDLVVDRQLWNGAVRTPDPAPQFRSFTEWLKKKGT